MHIAGLLGMPRRIYTYSADRGWTIWNQLSTVGAAMLAVCFAFFFWNLFVSVRPRRGRRVTIPGMRGRWNGPRRRRPRLTTSSKIPLVRSRRPLWDIKHPEDPDWEHE